MIDNYCICPVCDGYATRTRRRVIDRIVSVFMPVTRYRCHNDHCRWQGNIHSQHFNKNPNQHQNPFA